MRRKAYHQPPKKFKSGLLASAALAIMATSSLPMGLASAKVWTYQEILDNYKVLDAEAQKNCQDAISEGEETYYNCYRNQFQNFLRPDEADPLRTSDRLLLNQRSKEFAERTLTITYVDPTNLEIGIYFNDHSYNEYDRAGTTADTGFPHYRLTSLNIKWFDWEGVSPLIFDDVSRIIPNQEVRVKMSTQPEIDHIGISYDFKIHYTTNEQVYGQLLDGISYIECANPSSNPIPFYNEYREGMVCMYSSADEDDHSSTGDANYRAYLPDGSLPEPVAPDPGPLGHPDVLIEGLLPDISKNPGTGPEESVPPVSPDDSSVTPETSEPDTLSSNIPNSTPQIASTGNLTSSAPQSPLIVPAIPRTPNTGVSVASVQQGTIVDPATNHLIAFTAFTAFIALVQLGISSYSSRRK